MSGSPERPLGGQDPYAPKRSREQEQPRPQALGKLSRSEGDDEPVGLRRIQLFAPPPLVGRPPQPDAPRSSFTVRDIGLVAIVSIVSALAVTALYRFANTPPAPALQLTSASTRVVDAAPADEPASPAVVQPAATVLAAATPPTQKASTLAPAEARSSAAEPLASELRRAMSSEQRQVMASLVARGKELLRNGDFSSARLILERAADAGEADAALTLGSTYDPTVLARLGIRGQVANVDAARSWYEKAQEFGSIEAYARLKTLPNR